MLARKRRVDDGRQDRNNAIPKSLLTDRETIQGHPGHECDIGCHALADRRIAPAIAHPWSSSMTERGHACSDVPV
jgi:hypothetical protein